MIAPVDIEYKSTKLIKQGQEKMNSDFVGLADWIDKRYGVKTLNIIYDVIDSKPRPRLQIILEWESELKDFRTDYGFNEVRQNEIANEFKNILESEGKLNRTTILNFLNKPKYLTKDILIVFSAFEAVAKIEANWKIKKNEIEKLELKLKEKALWKIYPEMFNSPTFFFYTDKQIEDNLLNEKKLYFTSEYFNLLKTFDEFDYIKKENFVIKFDSKENFEKSYSSSWFYYDRR